MPFKFTEFPGLAVFEPKVFEDSRGYFFESYNESIFKEAGYDIRWPVSTMPCLYNALSLQCDQQP